VLATRDILGPVLTVKNLKRTTAKSGLTRGKGLAASIGCSEACTLTVKLTVRRTGARKASTILTLKRTKATTATQKLRLKVKPSALKRLASRKITIAIVAKDALGNATRLSRVLTLKA